MRLARGLWHFLSGKHFSSSTSNRASAIQKAKPLDLSTAPSVAVNHQRLFPFSVYDAVVVCPFYSVGCARLLENIQLLYMYIYQRLPFFTAQPSWPNISNVWSACVPCVCVRDVHYSIDPRLSSPAEMILGWAPSERRDGPVSTTSSLFLIDGDGDTKKNTKRCGDEKPSLAWSFPLDRVT